MDDGKKERRRKVEDREEGVRLLSHYLFTSLPPPFSQRKGGGLLLSTYKLLSIYLAIFDSRRFNWLISDGVASNNHSYHIRTKFLGL